MGILTKEVEDLQEMFVQYIDNAKTMQDKRKLQRLLDNTQLTLDLLEIRLNTIAHTHNVKCKNLEDFIEDIGLHEINWSTWKLIIKAILQVGQLLMAMNKQIEEEI